MLRPARLSLAFLFSLSVVQSGCFVFDSFVEDTSCLSERNSRTDRCLLPEQISAGEEHNCVKIANGQVMCWGGNTRSQLGLDTNVEVNAVHVPQTASLRAPASFVATGGFHTCAISGEDIYCWGANDSGQSGVPVRADSGRTVFKPTPVEDLPTETNWTMLAAGDAHTCALSESVNGAANEVWCWGDNQKGQINGQDPASYLPYPKKIELGDRVIERISAGATHTCAATSTNIYCWGDPQFGKTGRDDTDTSPKQLNPGWGLDQEIVDLEAGRDHNCALIEGGNIYCWGNGTDSRFLAQSVDTATTTKPVLILAAQGAETLPPMQLVQAGQRHTCTLSVQGDNGRVFCWGGNEDYQLGDGTNEPRHSPAEVANAQQNTDIVEMAVGGKHACALKRKSREIVCWGLNENGQSGQPFEEGGSQRTVKQPEPFTLPDPEDPENPPEDAGMTMAADASVNGEDAEINDATSVEMDATTPVTDAGVMDEDSSVSNPDAMAGIDTGVSTFCDNNDDCTRDAPQTPYCVMNVCVECLDPSDCSPGQVCQMNSCQDPQPDSGTSAMPDSGFFDAGGNSDGGAPPGPTRTLQKMAVGVDHNCVVTRQGQGPEDVHCWGALYDPYAEGDEEVQRQPRKIDTSAVGGGESIHEIAAGDGITCFTTNSTSMSRSVDQRMYCFGNPKTGIMGNPSEEWEKDGYQSSYAASASAGNGESIIMDIAVDDTDGGQYVTGAIKGEVDLSGSCGIFTVSGGGTDGFLAKYNLNGECQWVKRFNTSGTLAGNNSGDACYTDSVEERGNKVILHNSRVYVAGTLAGCPVDASTGLSRNSAMFTGSANGYTAAEKAGFVVSYEAATAAFHRAEIFTTQRRSNGMGMAEQPFSSVSDMVVDESTDRLYVVGRFQEEFETPEYTITATTGTATFVAVLDNSLAPAASPLRSAVKISRAWVNTQNSTTPSRFPLNYDAVVLDSTGRLVIGTTYYDEIFDSNGFDVALAAPGQLPTGLLVTKLSAPSSTNSVPQIGDSSSPDAIVTMPVFPSSGVPLDYFGQVTAIEVDSQDNAVVGGFWRGGLGIYRDANGMMPVMMPSPDNGPYFNNNTEMKGFILSLDKNKGFTAQGGYNGQRFFGSVTSTEESVVRKIKVDRADGRLVGLLEYRGVLTVPLGRTGATTTFTGQETDAVLCFSSLRDAWPAHCEAFQSSGDDVLTSFASKPNLINSSVPTNEYYLAGAYNWNGMGPSPTDGRIPFSYPSMGTGPSFALDAANYENAALVGLTRFATPKFESTIAQKIDLGPVLPASMTMTSAAPPIKMRLGGGHVCIEVDDGALINGQSTSSTQEACASCGVSAARKLWCWGKNDQRQSVSNETERLTSVGGNSRCGVEVMTEPMPIDVSNTDANVTGGACPLQVPYSIDELALGRSHACTRIKHPQYPINPDQALACWGEQSLNQAGQDTTLPAAANSTFYPGGSQIPLLMSNMSSAKYVLGSGPASDHTCLVKNGTKMVCWGRYYEGQLSPTDWDNVDMTGTVYVPYNESTVDQTFTESYLQNLDSTLTGREVVQIATGGGHTCFVVRSGMAPMWTTSVECFGANGRGQSGHTTGYLDGTTRRNNGPNVGNWASKPLTYSSRATVTGTTTAPLTPAIFEFSGTKQVVDLQLGRNHSCTLVEDTNNNERTMYCWGDNQKSQLQLDGNRRYSFSIGALEMPLP